MPSSLPEAVEKAAAQAVLALGLEGLGDKVYSVLLPSQSSGYNHALQKVTDVIFPCIQLAQDNEVEEPLPGSTETAEYIFPVRAWVADKNAPGNHGKKWLYLAWRTALVKLFDGKRLADVPEVRRVFTVPQIIFNPLQESYQHIASGVLWRFHLVEAR